MKYQTRRKLKAKIAALEIEATKHKVELAVEMAITDMYKFVLSSSLAPLKTKKDVTLKRDRDELEREMDEFDKSLGKVSKKPKPDTWTSYTKTKAKNDPYSDPWYYKGDKFDTHRW